MSAKATRSPPFPSPGCFLPDWKLHCLHSSKHILPHISPHMSAPTHQPPTHQPPTRLASCLWPPTALPHHLPGARSPQCPPQCSLPLRDPPTAGHTCLHLFASELSLAVGPCSLHTAGRAGESTPLLATPAPALNGWLQRVDISTPTSSSQLEDACSVFYTGPGLFRRIKFQFPQG